MAGKTRKAAPMTMKQYEASAADKKADKAALAKINSAKPKAKARP